MKLIRSSLFLAYVALSLATAAAQKEVQSSSDLVQRDGRFARGHWEFEDLAGTFFLFDRAGNTRLTMDILIDTARLGIMLNDPYGSGFLRGNVEFLGELFGGGIFNGPGDVIGGGTLFFRYNFIQPNARLVPYVQAGGGFVYTDYAEGRAGGNALSLSTNFNLQAIGGVRYLLNSKWSLNAEASYRHISNASTSDPNYGIDQLGGSVGLGFSF